jgi:CRP-like cAMP-binding protein
MVESQKEPKDKDILHKIKDMPALESFAEAELQELMKISKIVTFREGETVIDEGHYAGWAYYLLTGKVQIVKHGKELATLQQTGDVFGEMGAIDYGMRSASVYAMVDSSCLMININSVERLSDENRYAFRYVLFRGFAEALAQRLRITTDKYLQAQQELESLKASK